MKPQKARGNQRQSEAIRDNQAAPQALTSGAIRCNQMQSDAIRHNQTQSDAIRRNQVQSDAISMPGALCFRVFVFWAGRKGLCFVFLCFEPAPRACVLCFRVLADPPQNTGGRQHRSSQHTMNTYNQAYNTPSRITQSQIREGQHLVKCQK